MHKEKGLEIVESSELIVYLEGFIASQVIVEYCEPVQMRADILTKPLPAPRLKELKGLVMLSG
ncbi:hypothetical protein F441_13364 [Phytophthora nicotianae CJ01A1]|uniref:Uncharacterized protein n=1 Tax=Phytophthora nicotianae CJ01A1 TaxID=1317063 RepID=W2WL50_PHYNI|nr:hypothetical protein F441_13364 [Phytophthora nicotianae CJ01A1]